MNFARHRVGGEGLNRASALDVDFEDLPVRLLPDNLADVSEFVHLNGFSWTLSGFQFLAAFLQLLGCHEFLHILLVHKNTFGNVRLLQGVYLPNGWVVHC